MSYKSVNPATGEVLMTFTEHTDQEMFDALSQAENTFREVWSKHPYSKRARIIAKAAALILERKEELAGLATLEMGKRIAEARGEVELSASILQYYADNAETFLAPCNIGSTTGDAHIECFPLGVLIGVQPWSYPYYQLARFAAPNLMSGNTILLKHASSVPHCGVAFEKILSDAGLPKGAYTNLFLTNDQVGTLIDDPRIVGVALTGSGMAP